MRLVGTTHPFIATKVTATVLRSAHNLLSCTDSPYPKPEILQAKHWIINAFTWDLSYPNPIYFHPYADSSYSGPRPSKPSVASLTR